jgi:hypothetical protein
VRVIIAHGPCKSSLCIVPVLTDYISSPKRTMLGGQYINVSPGPRVRGPGSWASWALGPETWVRGTGSWVLHPGSWVPSSGSLALGVLGPGSRVLGRGPWVLGPGPELAGRYRKRRVGSIPRTSIKHGGPAEEQTLPASGPPCGPRRGFEQEV